MARAQALFVTGTDTGVGKTRFAAGLVRALRAAGVRAAGFKPILCGADRSDAAILLEATCSGGVPPFPAIDEINPVWIKRPVAPLAAALAGEAAPLDRCAILDHWKKLATRFEFLVIEGAGGWEVPLTAAETIAGLAREFAAPVIVVAANRLGVLNHAKLTVDAVARTGLPCAGLVLNEIMPPDPGDPARATNLAALTRMFPHLPIIPLGWEEPVRLNGGLGSLLGGNAP